jgi:hypothetical protein
MSGEHTYVVRVLRQTETALSTTAPEAVRSRLGKVVQKLAHAEDIHEALDRLYRVQGYEAFSLRLMWVLDRQQILAVALSPAEVVDFEVQKLAEILLPQQTITSLPRTHRREEETEVLHTALHRFGRSVEDYKRAIGRGAVHEELLYRIAGEGEALEVAAQAAGAHLVRRFAAAAGRLVHFAIDNGAANDERLANILDNANLTLQTLRDTVGDEDHDALQNMIGLLEDPRRLLE